MKNNNITRKKVLEVYLEGHFGSYSVGDLVNDLGVKAAAVVHVSHHDWKKLSKKICSFVLQFKKHLTDGNLSDFTAVYSTSAGPVCFDPTYVAPNL